MAIIKQLRDKLNNLIYPITTTTAVYDASGNRLDNILSATRDNNWEMLVSHEGGGDGKTYTIGADVIDSYNEFMIACQLGHNDHSRILASTIIPKSDFIGVTTTHSDGAHQAYYSSTYHTGVSYNGSGVITMYETSSAYAVLYARKSPRLGALTADEYNAIATIVKSQYIDAEGTNF